jgi:hypothetical protein
VVVVFEVKFLGFRAEQHLCAVAHTTVGPVGEGRGRPPQPEGTKLEVVSGVGPVLGTPANLQGKKVTSMDAHSQKCGCLAYLCWFAIQTKPLLRMIFFIQAPSPSSTVGPSFASFDPGNCQSSTSCPDCGSTLTGRYMMQAMSLFGWKGSLQKWR